MMQQVNLLPWRQARCRRRAGMLAALLIIELALIGTAMALLTLGWRAQRHELSEQLAGRRRLALEADERHRRLAEVVDERRRLGDELARFERAGADNRRYSLLLEQLPHLLPASVWLTSLSQRGDAVAASGCSADQTGIDLAHRRLQVHPLLTTLRWREVNRLENGGFRFQLQGRWATPASGREAP